MLEKYRNVITTNDDIADIATTLIFDKGFKEILESYSKHPYDADFFSINNNNFHLAVTTSSSEIKSDKSPELALTTATREAAIRLTCSGARYVRTDDSHEPILKMLGVFKNESYKTKMSFQNKGETIYIVSTKYAEDEYRGTANEIFLAIETAIWNRYITSAHHIDIYKGLFLSLIESSYPSRLGFDITTDSEIEEKEFLFGNCGYTAIITVTDEQEDDFVDFMYNNDIKITLLGHVTKGNIRIDEESYGHINEIFI